MLSQSTPAICGLVQLVMLVFCFAASSATRLWSPVVRPLSWGEIKFTPQGNCTGTLITEFLLSDREDLPCGSDSVMSVDADMWW